MVRICWTSVDKGSHTCQSNKLPISILLTICNFKRHFGIERVFKRFRIHMCSKHVFSLIAHKLIYKCCEWEFHRKRFDRRATMVFILFHIVIEIVAEDQNTSDTQNEIKNRPIKYTSRSVHCVQRTWKKEKQTESN